MADENYTVIDGLGNPQVFSADDVGAGVLAAKPILRLATGTVSGGNPVPVTGTVSTDGLTDAELRASPVPVSGPLTDTELRATPVPVSGTVSTGGLTDAELRATPVPVSGTVTATGPLTDTQLRATPVPVSGTVAVTGVATEATLLQVETAVELIDDAIVTDDSAFTPGTTKVMMAGFTFDDAAPDSVNEGDAGAPRMSANRVPYAQLRDAAGNERGANVNASNALLTAQTGALPAGTNNIGDVDVLSLVPGTGATSLGKAVDSAAGGTDTGVAALVVRDDVLATLTPADGEYTRLLVDSQGRLWNAGQVAHDSAIAGAPVRIGARAMTADISSVASGDQCDVLCDIKGKLVVLPYALNENSWQYAGPAITDTADDVVKTSAGAGLRNFVTSLTVINSHATVGTVVELKDGSTVIHRGYAAPLGGGYTVTFPMALKGSAATAVNVACVTTGSNTYVSASGYVAP